MPVFMLWSPPRARSTAFFRVMLERGDLLALHEPFEGLLYGDRIEVNGRLIGSPDALLAWLRDDTNDLVVFQKETTERRVFEMVKGDRRFLAEAHHAFLIRHPEEIARSLYALHPAMHEADIGLERLSELHAAVTDAAGNAPVVIDSDDLVARPDATTAAYCGAVGLPHIPDALHWDPGERPEWERSARWHVEVAASSRLEQRSTKYDYDAETTARLRHLAARHLDFYEALRAQKLIVAS